MRIALCRPVLDDATTPDAEDMPVSVRAALLRELAEMSVDPDAGLDRESDYDIWGFDRGM